MKERLENLDGLRGLSILAIVFFHVFYVYSLNYYYSQKYTPLFYISSFGSLGVNLFFLISGFVIAKSLYNSNSVILFYKNRWKRLFPSMFFASLIIYFFYFHFGFKGWGYQITLYDFIPGLFFIDPYLIKYYLKISLVGLSGVFWSLYVEVKFYFIAAILSKFFAGKVKYFIGLFYLFYVISKYLNIYFPNTYAFSILYKIGLDFSFVYFSWFASGMFFFFYKIKKKKDDFFLFLFFAFLSCLHGSRLESYVVFTSCIFLYIIFYFSFEKNFLSILINKKFFLFLGLISYELYLIHDAIIVSTSLTIYQLTDNKLYWPIIIFSISLAVFFATIIKKSDNFIKSYYKKNI